MGGHRTRQASSSSFYLPGLSQLSFVVATKWATISSAYPRKKSDTFGELMGGQ